MTQTPGLFIAVPPSDARRPELATLPLPTVTLSLGDAGEPVATRDGSALPASVTYANMVGLLSLSPEAMAEADALAGAWTARFGSAIPARLDLSKATGTPDRAISDWVIAALVEGRSIQAAHNVQLQRDLGLLRSVHDATQTAFYRLESYVYKLGGPTRSLAFHLEPFRHLPPVTLEDGGEVVQRLPICSAGLSDVGFWVHEPPQDPQGRLEASLELQESGEIVSEWTLSADQIHHGWHRLSRGICLGTDRQTVLLHLRWQGMQPLHLAQTMSHPDPRFCALRNGEPQPATLATAGWISVAGASLPLPTGAVIDEVVYPRRWIVPVETMRAARNTSPEGKVAYSDDLGGLIVTPGPTRPALARLAGAGAPGMQQIFCGVETKADVGPVVEYALAVVPADEDLRTVFGVPDLSRAQMTDWIALPVSYWAELQMFLEQPIETPSDIYVITRVAAPPEGQSAAELPEDLRCCFFSIRANA